MSATRPPTLSGTSSSSNSSLLSHAATAAVSAIGAATVTWIILRKRPQRNSQDRTSADDDSHARMLAEADAHSHNRHGMTPSQFNAAAHALVDQVTEYRSTLRDRPVRSQVQPGYLSALVPEKAPEQGESWSAIEADMERVVMPGITHWGSPRYFAYFPAYASWPSLLGEMWCSTFNTIGFSWIGSPVSTELETRCLDWLGHMLHLPPVFLHSSNSGGGGVLQGTAAEAAAVSLLAGKAKALSALLGENHSQSSADETIPKFVAYISDHTHGIIAKGAKITGISPQRVHMLRTTKADKYGLQLPAVQEAFAADIAAGLLPMHLTLTIGTTSSTAVDDVAGIAAWVRANHPSVWLHVDAAYAGSFAALPSHAHLFRGLEYVDSFSFNPHKSLLVAFDCCCLFVRARAPLLQALSLASDEAYLRNAHSAAGRVLDLKDWQLPFGRRFRSLKLWFTLRSYGVEGVRAHLQSAIDNAQRFKQHIERSNGRFQVVCEPLHFGLMCFQLVLPAQLQPPASLARRNELNERLKEACNDSGKLFFITSQLEGETILRLACNGESQHSLQDVDEAWVVIEQQAQLLFEEEGWVRAEKRRT